MPAQFAAVIAVACFILGLVLGAWFGHLMAHEATSEKIEQATKILKKAVDRIRNEPPDRTKEPE